MKINLTYHRRKGMLLAVGILIILAGFVLTFLGKTTVQENNSLDEFQMDSDRMRKLFPALPAFDRCDWKITVIGKPIAIAPIRCRVDGFFFLEHSTQDMLNDFMWTPATPQFDNGIPSSVEAISPSAWYKSQDFFMDTIASRGFVGDAYLDMEHGVLYIVAFN